MESFKAIFVVSVMVPWSAICMEIYVKRSQIEDQASSASGYAYQVHSGGPLSYTEYNNNNGELGAGIVAAPAQVGHHFGYPPITLGKYAQELQLPQQVAPAAVYDQQLNSYGVPVNPAAYALNPLPLELAKYSQPIEAPIAAPIAQVPLLYAPYAPQVAKPILAAPIAGPIAAPIAAAPIAAPLLSEKAQKFASGQGSDYSAASQSSKGEEGSQGYNSAQGYEKGAKGVHEKEGNKGYYNKEGGNKAGSHESGGHYAQNHESGHGVKGGSFGEKSGHKKGSKTTGFHKIHHKDEYKKDHSFYDESDNSGHFNKYGDFGAKHSAEKGGFAKGGHEEGGFQAGAQGVKGFQDKGRYVDKDSGFKGEKGQQSYHKNFQDYAKKDGEQEESEKGFSEGEALGYVG